MAAEAHAQQAQVLAPGLAQGLDLRRHGVAADGAQVFRKLEDDAAHGRRYVGLERRRQRLHDATNVAVQPRPQAPLQPFAPRRVEEITKQRLDGGLQQRRPGGQPGHHRTAPSNAPGPIPRDSIAVSNEFEFFVRIGLEGFQPRGDLAAERPLGGARYRLGGGAVPEISGILVGNEAEGFHPADEMALDGDLAVAVDGGQQFVPVLDSADQDGGALVDEALRQAPVQRVGQLVLYGPGPVLPARGVVEPVGVMGNVGPGADGGDARGQGLDAAVGALEPRHLGR